MTDAQKILELTFESREYQRFRKSLETSVGNSKRGISYLKKTEAKDTLECLVSILLKDL